MSLVRFFLLLAFIAGYILAVLPSFAMVEAATYCNYDADCERKLRVGSRCVDGSCSNPFAGGCFKTMLGEDYHSYDARNQIINSLPPQTLDGRVCNSDDGNEIFECLENEFDYFEIRIHNSNWEASIFVAWIIQIVLMEILRVPATVGLNSDVTAKTSFYSRFETIEYSSTAYAWDALKTGFEIAAENDSDGDPIPTTEDTNTASRRQRRLADKSTKSCEDTTEDCVHVLPEVWTGQEKTMTQFLKERIIEPVDGCGQVGKVGWFIPGAVAEEDPSLMSYYGLQGEANRAKLAETFKRPTTWVEYCEEVSADNCTTPDDVAENYPEDADKEKYFADGNYKGHFRMLPENNCALFPDTCTGYIVGPSCGWTTFVDSQLYWNDIVGLKLDGPLEPNNAYGYSPQIEIWRASNATRSPVMFWWWQPEAMIEEFAKSDWNFQMILLPTVTETCHNARIGPDDRCDDDIAIRRGSTSEGSCDNESNAPLKVLSSVLRQQTLAVEEPSRSPGYAFVRALKISDIEIQSLLNAWFAVGKDRYGSDAREAVCSWVVENTDALMSFVPRGHPRTIVEASNSDASALVYVAWAVAGLGLLGNLGTGSVVVFYRKTKVFVYAQVTFVYIIMLGFSLVTVGGFLYALEPTDGTCVARCWLTSLGYSIVLSAVLVKMSAINRIMQQTKRRSRVRITVESMLIAMTFLVLIDLVILIAWTATSPLRATETLVLPQDGGEPSDRSTTYIVESSTICKSRQPFWQYALEGWHGLLLLVAAVLAFQSRGIQLESFNEARVIGTMVYSQFVFMIARWIVFSLGVTMLIAPNVFGASMGLLYVMDTMLSTSIYVIPKCFHAKKDPLEYDPSSASEFPTGSSNSLRSSSNPFFGTSVSHQRISISNSELVGTALTGRTSVMRPRSGSQELNSETDDSAWNLRGRQKRRKSRTIIGSGSHSEAISDMESTSFHEPDHTQKSAMSSAHRSISNRSNTQRSISNKSPCEFYEG